MYAVEFYDQVLRELIAAVGAALFFANAFALLRRRRAADDASPPSGGSSSGSGDGSAQLTRAPIARTVTFMLIGLIVMVWAIASLVR